MYSIRDIIVILAVAASLPFCFVRPVYGISVVDNTGVPQSAGIYMGRGPGTSARAGRCYSHAGRVPYFQQFKKLFCPEVGLIVVLWLWFTLTTLNSVGSPEFARNAPATWFRWSFV